MIIALFNLIIYLLAVGLLIALVFYVVRSVPIPAPFGRLIEVAVVVIACLIVIALLLSMAGSISINMPKLS